MASTTANSLSPDSPPNVSPLDLSLRPVGNLLCNIGNDLVNERVCADLIRTHMRKSVENADATQLPLLKVSKARLASHNAQFNHHLRKCRCGFQSESKIVLALHSQSLDMSQETDPCCCICSFTTKKSRNFIRHMKQRHNLKAFVCAKMAQFQCHYCPFENNFQHRIEAHLTQCRKLFSLNINLSPCRMDSDIPIIKRSYLAPTDFNQNKPNTVVVKVSGSNFLPMEQVLKQFPFSVSPQTIMLQALQPTLIPSSLNQSLPTAHFVGTSTGGSLARPVLQPKIQQSNQTSSKFPSVIPVSNVPQAPLSQSTKTESNLQSPEVRFVLPSVMQDLSRTGMIIPSSVANSVPLPSTTISNSVSQMQPERQLLDPKSFGDKQMPFLPVNSSTAVRFQPLANIYETQLIQIGNQMVALVPHNGGPILTPVVFPPPVLSPTSNSLNINPFSSNQTNISSVVRDKVNKFQKPSDKKNLLSSVVRKEIATPAISSTSLDKNNLMNGMQICEICDGFVKDRPSLSVHFQRAHQVTVSDANCKYPSQPCSLCKQSFFTTSGLLRHYRTFHVNNSALMKPLDRCVLCKAVNLPSVVEHLSSVHRATMSLSLDFRYCGICSLRMMNDLTFERHMLDFHSSLFVNRNILLATIAASVPETSDQTKLSKDSVSKLGKLHDACKTCQTTVYNAEKYREHVRAEHMKRCSRCVLTFSNLISLQHHFRAAHSAERDRCPLCLKTVPVGQKFIRHVKLEHLKECCVRIKRLDSQISKEKKNAVTKTAFVRVNRIDVDCDRKTPNDDSFQSLRPRKRQKLEL